MTNWLYFLSDLEPNTSNRFPGVLFEQPISFLEYLDTKIPNESISPLRIFKKGGWLDISEQYDTSLAGALARLKVLIITQKQKLVDAIKEWDLLAKEIFKFLYLWSDLTPAPVNCKLSDPALDRR